MAILSVVASQHVDIRRLDFSNLYNGEEYQASSTAFRVRYWDDTVDELRGFGFRYDDDGIPVAGTVNSYAFYSDGVRSGFIDGFKLSMASIARAASTLSITDDRRLLSVGFAGSDSFKGGNLNDYLDAFAGNDTLSGLGGADILHGGSGNDKLLGGTGNDVLTGGAGADAFVFNGSLKSAANVDTITDYVSKDDSFQLENSIFVGLKGKSISADQFKDLTKGVIDPSDRIIYDRKNGDLYFDQDGSGGRHVMLKFADLNNHAVINAADFLII